MTRIKIRTLSGGTEEIETEDCSEELKAGDLIKEPHPVNNNILKAIVVGIDKSNGSIWTVDETAFNFRAGCWIVPGYIKLIRRPNNPDLTIEGLEKSLKEFINEK